MAQSKDRFEFPAELGLLLRELRLRAGLSLEEMARRMARSKGYISRVSRLENGKVRHPSLGLIADYLRVCRASFADLVSVLDKYTSKPVPLEVAGRERVKALVSRFPAPVAKKLDSYDIHTSVVRRFKGEAPLEPDERELRIRNQARAWLERGRLDQVLNSEMDNLGVMPLVAVRKFAFDYGHRVWRILKQTRPGLVRRPDKWRKTRAVAGVRSLLLTSRWGQLTMRHGPAFEDRIRWSGLSHHLAWE